MSASAAASDDESSAADAFDTSARARRRRQPDESSMSAGRGESTARGTHPGGPGSEATRVRRDALKKTLDPIVYSGPLPA